MPAQLTPPQTSRRLTDDQVEQIIGNLLRGGVLLAAFVVLIGGVFYLSRHGADLPQYHTFHGVPSPLRSVPGIIHTALFFRSSAIIQLGLLLLIATPVMRVALSLAAFAVQRDRAYVVMTLIVLAVLLFSLFWGGHL